MPPIEPILDPLSAALEDLVATRDEIREWVPQRHAMEMLEGILHFDAEAGIAAAVKELAADEFWVAGHIPQRPLFPGVLMIESAAQLCSYAFGRIQHDRRFFGFAGVDEVRFRGTVVPGDKIVFMVKKRKLRRNLGMFDSQAFVGAKMVYNGIITGMIVPPAP